MRLGGRFVPLGCDPQNAPPSLGLLDGNSNCRSRGSVIVAEHNILKTLPLPSGSQSWPKRRRLAADRIRHRGIAYRLMFRCSVTTFHPLWIRRLRRVPPLAGAVLSLTRKRLRNSPLLADMPNCKDSLYSWEPTFVSEPRDYLRAISDQVTAASSPTPGRLVRPKPRTVHAPFVRAVGNRAVHDFRVELARKR